MATLALNTLSLLEVTKRQSPKGNQVAIAEVLNRKKAVIQDAVWLEANGSFYHKFVRRAELPVAQSRGFNQGVKHAASKTTEHTAQIAIYEQYGRLDRKLADISANPAQARMDEGVAAIESIGKGFETDLFYGSIGADPNKFDGLSSMLSTLSAKNVVGASGTGGSCTSIYAIEWGKGKVYCAYPKGGKTGVYHENKGLQTYSYYENSSATTDTYSLEMYVDLYGLNGGLVVEDPRCIGRIANIKGTNVPKENNFIDIISQFPDPEGANIVFYCNRTVWAMIQKLVFGNKDTNTKLFYPVTDPFGHLISSFMGYPIRLSEGITEAEATLT